ncbi:MAG: hypothetical protein WCK31_00330 [bacterium]
MKSIRNLFLIAIVMYFTIGSSVLLTSVYALSSSSSKTSESSESSESRVSSSLSSKTVSVRPIATTRTAESRVSERSESSRTSSLELRDVKSIEESLKDSNTALSAYKAAKTADKLTALIALGTKVIDERISFLSNQLTTKVTTEVNISSENKTKLINLISEEISNLQLEKAKIQALTNITELKVEVKNIYEEHRIYATFGPKIYGLIASYRMQFLTLKLETTLSRVETTIQENQANLPNYESINEYLTNSKAEIATSKGYITDAITKFNSMEAAKDTKPAKDLHEKGRDDLAKAKKSLEKVKSYLKQIGSLIDKRTSSSNESSKSNSSETSRAN